MTAAPPDSAPSDPHTPGFDEQSPSAPESRSRASRPLLTTIAVVVALATVGLLAVFSGTADRVDSATDAAGTDVLFSRPFTTADGGTGTLADYQGQPLVVNFFASWCPPCRAELPDFEAVHQELGGDVTFIGVNQDFTEATWKAFVDEAQVSYDTVFQPNSEIWNDLDTKAMPTTAFITRDGEVAHTWAGLLTDDKLTELINEHLMEKS